MSLSPPTSFLPFFYFLFNIISLLIFLLLKKASYFYLALRSCAFSTFAVIFCPSVRKAHVSWPWPHLVDMDPPQAPLGMFLCSRHKNSSKLARTHATSGFWCLLKLLGIKVNNSITEVLDSSVLLEDVLQESLR